MQKEINPDEQKVILIEMLKYIDNVCRTNNLKYYVFGGTLIGTIRHKGFIPWDDDIDICVPMEDYKKLIEILKNEDKYNIHSPYDNKEYYYFFTKMTDKRTVLIEDNFKKINDMGVFLDIFPLYSVPNDKKELIEFAESLNSLEKKYFRLYGFEKYYNDKKLVRRIIKAVVYFPQFLNKKKIHKLKYEILDKMESYEGTGYIGSIVQPCSYKSAFPVEVFSETIRMEFEGIEVNVPKGYNKILTNEYGDYMKLPPEDKRYTEHNFVAYWKRNS